jgi:hypothetical protein
MDSVDGRLNAVRRYAGVVPTGGSRYRVIAKIA